MNRLRWGVLGVAKIARGSVIPAIGRSKRNEMLAIASRDAGRAAAAAGEHDIPRSYGSYEELLADPDVDAVYIPLPNDLHARWSMAAADAGKHVLCEKPLGLDAADARQIVDHCADAGVLLQEAFMYKHHPAWRRMRRLVADGAIGELVGIDTWFSFFLDDPANIRFTPGHGGGALLDIGCYPISVTRWFLQSEPETVTGVVHIDRKHGVDLLSAAVLGYPDVTSAFTVSMRAHLGQRVLFVGTEGRLWNDIAFNPPPDQPVILKMSRPGDTPFSPDVEEIDAGAHDQYAEQVDAFADVVLDGADPVAAPDDPVRNMRVIDRVFEAANALRHT